MRLCPPTWKGGMSFVLMCYLASLTTKQKTRSSQTSQGYDEEPPVRTRRRQAKRLMMKLFDSLKQGTKALRHGIGCVRVMGMNSNAREEHMKTKW